MNSQPHSELDVFDCVHCSRKLGGLCKTTSYEIKELKN